jgi:hypothetical protein
MTQNNVDPRTCAFCGIICRSGTKKTSICTTRPDTLIEQYGDAYQSVYKGERKNQNEISHSRCANALKEWNPQAKTVSSISEVNKTPSKGSGTSPGSQNFDLQLTNHNNSVVIGGFGNSPEEVKINYKRLFDQIRDDSDVKGQLLEGEPPISGRGKMLTW